MKLLYWNINGLKAFVKKTESVNFLTDSNSDIICLSETKTTDQNIDIISKDFLIEYKFKYYLNSNNRKGYSGLLIYSKIKPINIYYGFNNKELNSVDSFDNEGRLITIEFKEFYLIAVYTPNSGDKLKRLNWRIDEWDTTFNNYINMLYKKKNIIICGDLNVARDKIDLKHPDKNTKTAGFTIEERNSFENLLKTNNLIDVFRYFHKDKIQYTYWNYRKKCRENNVGWRIDYFLVNIEYINIIKDNIIHDNILGSDHAPIELNIYVN